jgi:excisionase family DNA binding protein
MNPVLLSHSPNIRIIQIKEAASILGVSAVTVRRRVRDGSLPHIRISGRLYFKLNELNAFIEAHRGELVF